MSNRRSKKRSSSSSTTHGNPSQSIIRSARRSDAFGVVINYRNGDLGDRVHGSFYLAYYGYIL